MSGGQRPVDGWGHEFGKEGASGTLSAELLARELADRQGEGIFPQKSWRTQLKYLDGGPAGMAELARRGLTPTRRQRIRWAAGGRPTKANQDRIREAYRQLRGERVIRDLTRRLERGGAGTRVEISPVDQSQVPAPRRRDLDVRTINVRHWLTIVHAWVRGDMDALKGVWGDQLANSLGSQWGSYEYASAVGILGGQ